MDFNYSHAKARSGYHGLQESRGQSELFEKYCVSRRNATYPASEFSQLTSLYPTYGSDIIRKGLWNARAAGRGITQLFPTISAP